MNKKLLATMTAVGLVLGTGMTATEEKVKLSEAEKVLMACISLKKADEFTDEQGKKCKKLWHFLSEGMMEVEKSFYEAKLNNLHEEFFKDYKRETIDEDLSRVIVELESADQPEEKTA